jgi:hypothetical protein
MAWNAAGIQCGLIFSKIPVSVDFCFTFHQGKVKKDNYFI